MGSKSLICLRVALAVTTIIVLAGFILGIIGVITNDWARSTVILGNPVNYKLQVRIGLNDQNCTATKIKTLEEQTNKPPGLLSAIMGVVDAFVPIGQMAEDKCKEQMQSNDLSYLSTTKTLIIIALVAAGLTIAGSFVAQFVRHWLLMVALAVTTLVAFILQLIALIVFTSRSKEIKEPNDPFVESVTPSLGYSLVISFISMVLYAIALVFTLGTICCAKQALSNRVFSANNPKPQVIQIQ